MDKILKRIQSVLFLAKDKDKISDPQDNYLVSETIKSIIKSYNDSIDLLNDKITIKDITLKSNKVECVLICNKQGLIYNITPKDITKNKS